MRRRIVWRLGSKLHRKLPRMSLSQRFFWVALSVVVVAMLILGNLVSDHVSRSIATGVGGTAAASIEALVSRSLGDQTTGDLLTSDRRAELDEAFEIGNDAESARLLQIRIRDLYGRILYASLGGLRDETDTGYLQSASQGQLFARVVELPLQSIGTLPERTLGVLKIYTPLAPCPFERDIRRCRAVSQCEIGPGASGAGAIGRLDHRRGDRARSHRRTCTSRIDHRRYYCASASATGSEPAEIATTDARELPPQRCIRQAAR